MKFSLEITPTADIAELPQQLQDVSIAFLPKSTSLQIVEQAVRLRQQGFNPIPHIPARRIQNYEHLENFIRQLREQADVRQVLAIGGDGEPAGEYAASLDLLQTGLLDGLKVGVAGHPEGTPYLDLAEGDRVLQQKNQYADARGMELYIVTQWSLNPEAILNWLERIQAFNTLPIHIGIPGPTTLPSLMKFAALCGVKTSFNALRYQPQKLTQLIALQTPDFLIEALQPAVDRFHVFPFGGLKRTRDWLEPKLTPLDVDEAKSALTLPA